MVGNQITSMRIYLTAIFLLLSVFVFGQNPTFPTQFIVAQDGTGDFKTIQEAVNAVRDWSEAVVPIYIKPGTYLEKLVIPTHKTKIKLVGQNRQNTIISWNDYSGKNGLNTYSSYTVLVQGADFVAENLTFLNSAGPVGQAVALHIEGDRAVVTNCAMLGHQDTLFASSDTSRQYYKNCYIEGTTDFIFGAATVVFEDCEIKSKKNSYITAASTSARQKFGFVFINCKLTADSTATKVYLGRPWRSKAKTVFIRTQMGKHIAPEGWHVWNKNNNHLTAYYAEYGSFGEGANFSKRERWTHQLSKNEIKAYQLGNIFSGQKNWLPQ